jgi:ubiquinone/menaquinone biosynthesis C-methylase UbiE
VYAAEFRDPASLHNDEDYGFDRTGAGGEIQNRAHAQQILKIVSEAADGRRGRLLDIGTGRGDLLLEAARSGWDAQGVEISEDAAKVARERLGLKVTVGTLAAARFPDRYFDAVTMLDVIEHVPDPVADLREVRRVLKGGGIVVLETPNFAGLMSRMGGRYWPGYMLPHINLFMPANFSALVQKSGFELGECRTVGAEVFSSQVIDWLGIKQRLYDWLYWHRRRSIARSLTRMLAWAAARSAPKPAVLMSYSETARHRDEVVPREQEAAVAERTSGQTAHAWSLPTGLVDRFHLGNQIVCWARKAH